MKRYLLALFLLVAISPVFALETMQLTDEEARLVRAFRQDPTLFRQVLYGGNGGASGVTGSPVPVVLGPRDVVDVTIDSGKVQFYGKNSEFEPLSFRISRGETKVVIFRKKGALTETRVLVSYRPDGLHFDIPESYSGVQSPENGLLIIPESSSWDKGDPMSFPGKLSGRVSRGEDLQFRIRYALMTGRGR